MKRFTSKPPMIIPVLCLLCIEIFSFQSKAQTGNKLVTGYFANTKKTATLTLQPPKMNGTETGCDGGCITQIKFSDPAIPIIAVKDCIGGELTNLGDLDSDGLDEIGLLPGWFAGCWHSYRVYTFKNNKWQLAVPPFPTHCNEFEAEGIKPIVKDAAKPGYVLVTYSAFKGNEIVFKTKSEPIN